MTDWQQPVTNEEIALLKRRVEEAIQWAREEVPAGAIISHHGIATRVGDFLLQFTTRGPHNAVVTFYISYGERREAANTNHGPDPWLTENEVQRIRDSLPIAPIDEWNGIGQKGISFIIPCVWHETLFKAHNDNYKGCPRGLTAATCDEDEKIKSGSFFVFCSCKARSDAYGLITSPWEDHAGDRCDESSS